MRAVVDENPQVPRKTGQWKNLGSEFYWCLSRNPTSDLE